METSLNPKKVQITQKESSKATKKENENSSKLSSLPNKPS